MNNSLISPDRLWELQMVQVVLNRFAGVSCKQRNCWKFSPNSSGKFSSGFKSEDTSLHLNMGIFTAAFFCHKGTFLSLSSGVFLWKHLWIKKELNHPVAVNIINVLDFLKEGTFQSVLRKELSHPSGAFQPHRSWKICLVNYSLCSFFDSAVGCKTKSFFFIESLTLPEFLKQLIHHKTLQTTHGTKIPNYRRLWLNIGFSFAQVMLNTRFKGHFLWYIYNFCTFLFSFAWRSNKQTTALLPWGVTHPKCVEKSRVKILEFGAAGSLFF